MRTTVINTLQMQDMPWHGRGLFMGMHWVWWTFWIILLVVLLWALWRAVADRVEMSRAIEDMERAEEALRHRLARAEISEDEYAREVRVLRESLMGR